ncbi:homoprotocatechuate degradation regulator HpaR [Rhizobium laguerreae]|uniref:Homoprotocatechuate degradation regulator HpaR n=1 Tax=Rhizobium laguerreae TaxID=1076926 RepID=A0ABR6GHR4_9HYPH|nr:MULTISPECIES: homoprotocatechuate degradation operon regulator HpaR [Rhizobium/Agrobacterium group]MBB3165794.1 homoprotocatechuate degradation regulator HpaR [Rhizobium laguerreae]OOO46630.1 homoprotocatechuate degradation operon regulator, HpaR [Rhizobium laguerreae]
MDQDKNHPRLLRSTRQALPIALLKAREAVMGHFRPMLAQHNVTEQQWRVLRLLSERGQIDATELAQGAALLAPSLTRMIKALEDRKLIRTTKDTADGRRLLVRIDDAGAKLLEEVRPESLKIYEELELRIGHDKIEALISLLNEVTDKATTR